MRKVSEVVVTGPLAGSAAGFADYLEGLGYSPLSVSLRLRLFAHVSRWMESERLEPAGFDSMAVDRFLSVRQASHQDLASIGTLAPVLRYLRSTELIPAADRPVINDSPVERVLRQWAVYLRRERGLQDTTVHGYLESGRPFIVWILGTGKAGFETLDAEAVATYVSSHVTGLTISQAKRALSGLRSLLRFLFAVGVIDEPLDGLIPARAGYRDAGVPRGLGPGQVDALIAACDPGTAIGRRDLAIVLLLARLGLRSGEVARLCLDDIDWRNGSIRVTGKGGYIDTVPLPAEVGAALAAHLRSGRPETASSRAVFLRSRAPYRAMSSIGSVLKWASRRAGLSHVGAHQLRHSVATATINAGASLEEVAQLMRHRSLTSTAIYAKVDLVSMRALTKPWPIPARAHFPTGGIR